MECPHILSTNVQPAIVFASLTNLGMVTPRQFLKTVQDRVIQAVAVAQTLTKAKEAKGVRFRTVDEFPCQGIYSIYIDS